MDHRVQVVIALIVRDLRHELSVKQMANLVNLSSSRLRHLFKKETGLSFAQYIKTHRLHKAKELVETTFLSMKEIMNRVGLHDKSHFAKDFKKAFGVTPAQHRARSLVPEGLLRKASTMK